MVQTHTPGSRTVIVVKLDLNNHNEAAVKGFRAGMGIELSRWCQEQGLIHNQDYDWAVITAKKELHFRFYGNNQSVATLFTLKWAQYL